MISPRLWRHAVTLLGLTVIACGSSEGDSSEDDLAQQAAGIDSYIASIPLIAAPAPKETIGQPKPGTAQGDYYCTSTNVSQTRQYDRIVAYTGGSDALWPGALIKGSSVASGLLTPTPFERRPVTFSLSLESLGGRKGATLYQPSLSSFRDAIGEILAKETKGATAANIYSELEQVHSQSQLDLALGASVSWGGSMANISGGFDFRSKEAVSRYVVRYVQSYYTVDVDAPTSPRAVFAPHVTLDEVKARINPQDPPAYISSITYGRMVVFTFESKASAEELGTALRIAYGPSSGSITSTQKSAISSSKVTAFILGGSGGQAAQALTGYDAIMDFIKQGGNYSKDSPGAPIAYKLRYLKDNSAARLSLTQDYEVSDCQKLTNQVKVTVTNIKVESSDDDALQVYGNISAQSSKAPTPVSLMSKGKGDAIDIGRGDFFPRQGVLAERVLQVEPKAGQSVSIQVSLRDYNPYLADEDLGNERLDFPFELGWKKTQRVMLTGANSRVAVEVTLEPL